LRNHRAGGEARDVAQFFGGGFDAGFGFVADADAVVAAVEDVGDRRRETPVLAARSLRVTLERWGSIFNLIAFA